VRDTACKASVDVPWTVPELTLEPLVASPLVVTQPEINKAQIIATEKVLRIISGIIAYAPFTEQRMLFKPTDGAFDGWPAVEIASRPNNQTS
jgi:hypothetical protein